MREEFKWFEVYGLRFMVWGWCLSLSWQMQLFVYWFVIDSDERWNHEPCQSETLWGCWGLKAVTKAPPAHLADSLCSKLMAGIVSMWLDDLPQHQAADAIGESVFSNLNAVILVKTWKTMLAMSGNIAVWSLTAKWNVEKWKRLRLGCHVVSRLTPENITLSATYHGDG